MEPFCFLKALNTLFKAFKKQRHSTLSKAFETALKGTKNGFKYHKRLYVNIPYGS